MARKRLTATEKIKILTRALRFYRRNGTNLVLRRQVSGLGHQIENGSIADKALFEAGVHKRRTIHEQFQRGTVFVTESARKRDEREKARLTDNLRKREHIFHAEHRLSPALRQVICDGADVTFTRTEIVRRMWSFIKKNNLRDPNNPRTILATKNPLLNEIFGKDINMFEMTKILSKHLTRVKS